jgi:DNA-binding MarR family transcriptional regulator
VTLRSLPHARHQLDAAFHSPIRFSIVAALATVDEAEFAYVRDSIEISDAVLSKQAAGLEQNGYVKIRKGYVGKYPRTWLSLTKTGRKAYERHVVALHEITSNSTTPLGSAQAPRAV